jgi:predicted Zn-dependent protease
MSREIGISILLSAVTSDKTPQGVLTAADLTQQILGLQYSRQQEQEADVGGLDYMYRAGYNPYGMVETVQMLESEQKQRPIEFLSTHPAPQNRIVYLTENIRTKYHDFEGLKIGKEDYHRAVLERLSN